MISRRDFVAQSLAAAGVIAFGIRELNAMVDLCTLTCSQTRGPCYYANTPVRGDITEGKSGLPTLLRFLVVNADTCQPIENASIDIWHTDASGVYSAPTAAMCNAGDALARTQTFLRGVQVTDRQGLANFHTIFPGWYSGRTTHIHATVRLNSTQIVTTQFYFEDALTDHIYRNHPAYTSRRNRDTTNVRDGVIGGNIAPFLFKTKLIGDRSLEALKVIAIRTSATRCRP